MRVLLADDHELLRQGLRDCLGLMEVPTDVVEAGTLDEALERLDKTPGVALAILDLFMPGMNGFRGLDELRRRHPEVPVAVISGTTDRRTVLEALEHGALGFLPKTMGTAGMRSAVRLMLSGERYLPAVLLEDAGEGPAAGPDVPGLTPREREVWGQLAEGRTNKEIARALELQEVTVKLHVRSLFRKIGVSNRTQAARLLLEPQRVPQ